MNEVRNKKGEKYPPRTIYQLLCGIQRVILETSLDFPKICDERSTQYRDLHRTCDTVFRKLHSDGVGTSVRHAEPILPEEEDKLWSTVGVLSTNDPILLQRAAFYIGKHFCVRGGDEQRKSKPSQFFTLIPDRSLASQTPPTFATQDRVWGNAIQSNVLATDIRSANQNAIRQRYHVVWGGAVVKWWI